MQFSFPRFQLPTVEVWKYYMGNSRNKQLIRFKFHALSEISGCPIRNPQPCHGLFLTSNCWHHQGSVIQDHLKQMVLLPTNRQVISSLTLSHNSCTIYLTSPNHVGIWSSPIILRRQRVLTVQDILKERPQSHNFFTVYCSNCSLLLLLLLISYCA